MERYIGIVTAVSGQRAKVRIERGLKKGEKPRILDCWNTCEAKKGTYVEVEERTLGERQGKWIVRGIPLLTLLAGAIFGRAVSRYLPFDLGVTMFIGAIVWGLLGFQYARTFKRDVTSRRGKQWAVTGYYTEGMLPEDRVES